MKIAIVGSRTGISKQFVFETLYSLLGSSPSHGDILISGGALGVDSFAKEYWDKHQGQAIIYLPDWKKFGKSAGFKRNALIIQDADLVLAFWDGHSKGTANSIELAIRAHKPLNIYVR